MPQALVLLYARHARAQQRECTDAPPPPALPLVAGHASTKAWLLCASPQVVYLIEIYTANEQNASTPTDTVFLQLSGDEGESHEISLMNNPKLAHLGSYHHLDATKGDKNMARGNTIIVIVAATSPSLVDYVKHGFA